MGKNKKNVRAADVIRARRLALNTREGYKSLFFRIIVLGLTAYLIFTGISDHTEQRIRNVSSSKGR